MGSLFAYRWAVIAALLLLLLLVWGWGVLRTACLIYRDGLLGYNRLPEAWLRLAWRSWRGLRWWRAYARLALHEDDKVQGTSGPPPLPPPKLNRDMALPKIETATKWVLLQDEYIQDIDLKRHSWLHPIDPNLKEHYWIVGSGTPELPERNRVRILLAHAWAEEKQGWIEFWGSEWDWQFRVLSYRSPVLWGSGERNLNDRPTLVYYQSDPHPWRPLEHVILCGTVFTLIQMPEEVAHVT